MAWRLLESELRDIVRTESDVSVGPFIDTANTLTDYVSSQDSDSVLTAALLKQIELYLAAHFYSHRDQLFSEKKSMDASAVFQGETAMGLRSTQYGQAAVDLDVSGTLAKLGKGKKLAVTWLGKPPSEQTDYVDRD